MPPYPNSNLLGHHHYPDKCTRQYYEQSYGFNYSWDMDIPIRRTRNSSISSSRSSSGSGSNGPKHPQLFKTTLCKSLRDKEPCRFGNRCWFAHGEHELRPSFENRALLQQIEETPTIEQYSSTASLSSPPTSAMQQWMLRSLHGDDTRSRKMQSQFHKIAVNAQMRAAIEAVVNSSGTSIHHHSPFHSEQESHYINHLDKARHSVSSLSDSSASSVSSLEGLSAALSEWQIERSSLEVSTSREICDMFAVYGICPLGEECMFEHRMREYSHI